MHAFLEFSVYSVLSNPGSTGVLGRKGGMVAKKQVCEQRTTGVQRMWAPDACVHRARSKPTEATEGK